LAGICDVFDVNSKHWHRVLLQFSILSLAVVPTTAVFGATTATYQFMVGVSGQTTSTSVANVDVGSNAWSVTQAINSVSYTLSLAGFDANGTPHNLFTKDGGIGEQGVGLVGTLDNELTLNAGGTALANFIRYDVSQVYQAFAGSVGQILIGSTTATEKLDLWGSNTATDKPGTSALNLILQTILPAQAGTWVNLPNWGTYKYYFATVHTDPSVPADNVLVQAIQIANISAVPEPGTYAAGAAVALMVGGAALRRRAARKA
jgi:hypothetical protein